MKETETRGLMNKQTMLVVLVVLCGTGVLAYGQPGAGKPYDARDPFICKSKKDPAKGAPSPGQVKDYIQCANEGITAGLLLVENVQVEIGKSRPYSSGSDSGGGEIDPAQPVYPVRGTWDYYTCWIPHPGSTVYPVYSGDKGKNCNVNKAAAFAGACYKTSFGDWSCRVRPADFSATVTANVPPPK